MDTIASSYRRWQRHAAALLRPLEALMVTEGAELSLDGPASDHDQRADRLEAFARPCLLAVLWWHSLRHAREAGEADRADRQAVWFRQALLRGTCPDSPHYWGPNANFHQNGVEMGLLGIALELGREALWEPLSEAEQDQVARWMASNRGTGHHWNNHFFFGIFALEFLQSVGRARPTDRLSIGHWFDEMELMYRGQGWFMDGTNQAYDHYNAYAFHFYAPIWCHLYGERDPARVERWSQWTGEFLASYQHFFAPSGEHPAFGRSITYRFNASAPFAVGHLSGQSPLAPGRSRRLCTRNLEFFLDRPIPEGTGALGLGWTDVFPGVAEPYSCAGSVYWCAKAFTALLIPPDDPFWTADEVPLVSEGEDYAHCIKPAGLVVRKIGEAVEILNAGSSICVGNRDKFGAYKWGKLAYRTDFAFTLGSAAHYSADLGLTATDPRDGRTFGRHYTVPLELTEAYYLSSYNLGDRELQCNVAVETLVAWEGGWFLQVHRIDVYQASELAMGGFALPLTDPKNLETVLKPPIAQARGEGRQVALQGIGDFGELGWTGRLQERGPRAHLIAPFHQIPILRTTVEAGQSVVLASWSFAGSSNEPDLATPWKIVSLDSGHWRFDHRVLGPWSLRHGWLPRIST